MKKQIESIELGIEKMTPTIYIECECGFSKQYYLREVLNFLKKEEILKSYNIGEYQGELYGEVDKIHILDKGKETERIIIETIPIFEYVDENYEDIEWFLKNRRQSLKF
jgi:hypothetical protein